MQAVLSPTDLSHIRETLDASSEIQVEQVAGLLMPALEAAELNLSHQIEDLARDAGMGFNEVDAKIEYLRCEINEIKQSLNSLLR